MNSPSVPQEKVPTKLRFQTGRVIFALIMREMSTTHGRSPGGYLWAILEPVGGIAMLTVAFSFFLRSPPVGTSFALFYASGLLPFMLYSDLAQKVSQTIRFSRPLLIYPKVTFLDAVLARFLLNLLTQVLVQYIVLTAVVAWEGVSPAFNFPVMATAIGLAAFLGLSMGTINCLLFAVFPVWERVWAVVTRPLLLFSCLFYTFESLPASGQAILWYNPLAQIVGIMRSGIYDGYTADYVSLVYLLTWCLVPATVGVYFLRIYHKKILNEL